MAKFLDIIKGRGRGGNAQKMLSSLTQKTPWVQVEVENSKIRFLSRLSLGSGGVLMTKPKTLDKKYLETEGWIRISAIPVTSEELRLQITTPTFGSPASYQFLCKIPGAVTVVTKRNEVRWDTSPFKNLLLAVAAHSFPYRIMDLSRSGLMIRLREGTKNKLFPIDMPLIRPAILIGGKKKPRWHWRRRFPVSIPWLGWGWKWSFRRRGNPSRFWRLSLKCWKERKRNSSSTFRVQVLKPRNLTLERPPNRAVRIPEKPKGEWGARPHRVSAAAGSLKGRVISASAGERRRPPAMHETEGPPSPVPFHPALFPLGRFPTP